ncbi:hypothetical protein Pcinc_036743 [Petrolisthes cinctipes]|uniref:C2 domain-containing protein n=1 Tax=Petrolisthes cinctipes TaxID=88211 RepID=A0AAE1EPE5_PETCI|nr:hypothetical protein Pcinc_036743 [Petrolisthes cinctipes]
MGRQGRRGRRRGEGGEEGGEEGEKERGKREGEEGEKEGGKREGREGERNEKRKERGEERRNGRVGRGKEGKERRNGRVGRGKEGKERRNGRVGRGKEGKERRNGRVGRGKEGKERRNGRVGRGKEGKERRNGRVGRGKEGKERRNGRVGRVFRNQAERSKGGKGGMAAGSVRCGMVEEEVCRRTNNPTYRERFLFALEEEEVRERCLAFYMYASDKFTNTLIGEVTLKLTDLDLSAPASALLTLTDTGQRGVGYGEIMFSLSYLPTAERLTVVVVKARSLQFSGDKNSGDPFVKVVYVLQNGKKVMKKKTSMKKDTRTPVFNEAMIFSVPAPALHNIQLRVTVAEQSNDGGPAKSVGHVIVGTQATGKALSHWNQMMSALRKPIALEEEETPFEKIVD